MPLSIVRTLTYGLVMLAICLSGLPARDVAARSMTVEINDFGSTREEAERRVLLNAVRDGLTRFMNEQAKHPSMKDRILKRLKAIESDHYRPLVKRWRLDLDGAGKDKHFLEGKVTLDTDVLKLWADEWLRQLSAGGKRKRAALRHRLSLYIVTEALEQADLTAEERALRRPFMSALEQRLISSGYDIKREAQKRQAQYLLQLAQSRLDRQGLSGSVNFTVEVFENRADGSLATTADGYAEASLTTTESALRKELLKRAAVKVAAELQRKFEHLAVAKQATELVFFSAKDIRKRWVKLNLIEGLAEIYGLTTDAEIDDFDEAVNPQVTEENDHYTFSFLVPDDYQVRSTQLEKGLIALHEDVLKSDEAEAALAAGGKKWNVFDANAKPSILGPKSSTPEWIVKVERLLQDGKLDAPPGLNKNVLDTIRRRLSRNPKEPESLEFLSRLSSAFVTQSYDAMDKEQLGAAGRALNRADRALVGQPALKAAQAEVQKARDVLKAQFQRPKPTSPEPKSPVQKTAGPISPLNPSQPRVVFPELEARLRGPSLVKKGYIHGLAADVDGIWQVTANGKPLDFKPANGEAQRFLDTPGAQTQRFRIPYIASRNTKIVVTVTDTQRQERRRTLVIQSGKVSVQTEEANQSGREILERGRYWALLFGNQNYQKGLSVLKTPHNDVDELASVLVEHYNFDPKRVFVVKDATRDDMLTKLHAMHDIVKGNDSLLLFYAGHGHQDKGFGGKGFWLPVDGLSQHSKTQHARSTWVPNSQVRDILEASRAKHILLISDSCYSGSFKTRTVREQADFAANADFFYGLAAKKSRRAITSGDLEPVSDVGAPGHSIFAYHLIQTLKRSRGALNGERLFQTLFNPVMENSKQTPQYFAVQDAGDQGGDFVFVPRGRNNP